jgi:NAD+ diphosphatase
VTGPPLARSGLDRAAHHRRDPQWLAQAWRRGRVVVVEDGRTLVADGRLVLLDPAVAPAGERLFLGVDGAGVPHFAVAGALPEVPGAARATLREVGERLPELDAGLLVTAVALVNWHARHPFSPLTGAPTTVAEAGWTRVTADGEETLWPRTDPAVIVVVHDGVPGPQGRCLLGSGPAWVGRDGLRRYSCLAGFVEPGESAEATVAREVAEEVGVAVRDVRYVASQGWPFPGSLMLGFTAVADPAQPLTLDPAEIADARWFSRAEIAAVVAGERTDLVLPAGGVSIAGYLVQGWLAESLAT